MTTQAELATDLQTLVEQVNKIGAETDGLKQKVSDLEAAIANAGNTSPEVDAALAALKAQLQVVDDKVTDATP